MLHQELENVFYQSYEKGINTETISKKNKSKCCLFFLSDMFILNRGTKVKLNRVNFWNYNSPQYKKPIEKFIDKDRKGKCILIESIEEKDKPVMIYDIEVKK
jgi:hypothetical protein